jgi:hypothetical protein
MAHHGGAVNAMDAQAILAREISHIEEQIAHARVNDTFNPKFGKANLCKDTFAGRMTEVNPVQPAKAFLPIDVNESGK